MYWLLDEVTKSHVRETMTGLAIAMSTITGSIQGDQLFPFVGRKDRRKASVVVAHLSGPGDTVVDPFSGSGMFTYAAVENGRIVRANEWEPYTKRLSDAPWRLPATPEIERTTADLISSLSARMNYLYGITCDCGEAHVLDSQFFDRVPRAFHGVTPHERLGTDGRTITFRGKHKCPACGRTEKFFTLADQAHLAALEKETLPPQYATIFARALIKNSRINLSDDWTVYGKLFPQRSKLALAAIWQAIADLKVPEDTRMFFQDAFLSILPQAKYKDYRSKSQDLHVPERQLREVNVLYRFVDQIRVRAAGLSNYSFSGRALPSPIESRDFRDFLGSLPVGSAHLLLTDPPWSDGNAYFEKAQLYHPWLDYDLQSDTDRLENEMVVTDAPSRARDHDEARWWSDIEELFHLASSRTKDLGYFALFFRPIRASRWLENVNRLKLLARASGFEPLLTIDASSPDPSMRIQQSASYVFSSDVVFVFLKLPATISRRFVEEVDLDHLAFRVAEELQESSGAFTQKSWRSGFAAAVIAAGVPQVNLPIYEEVVVDVFNRYMREVEPTKFVVRAETPFTGQLFDTPAAERLFAYVPTVVRELTEHSQVFTYDMFLLKLAAYVENGTRMLINDVQLVDLRTVLSPYAVPLDGGKVFRKRPVPELPVGTARIMDLDPYEFERFSAQLLRLQGYTDVAVQGGSGDRGVDISAVDPQGRGVVVQCKRYISNVSAAPIQRLHSFSISRGAQRRIMMSTSGYTRDAIDEAQRTDTNLVDGAELERLVAEYMPYFLRRQDHEAEEATS